MGFDWKSVAAIETNTVQQIPMEARTGQPRHLLWIWFSINIMPLTVVTGALGPSLYHLTFGWTLIAIVVGNLIGAIFMALHSAQGPGLGIPQMIQSRAQFGSYGALAVVFVAILGGVGFAASIFVLGGQALHQISDQISVNGGIVLVAIAVGIVLIFGYELFHRLNRLIVGILGVGVLLAYIWLLGVNGLPAQKVEGDLRPARGPSSIRDQEADIRRRPPGSAAWVPDENASRDRRPGVHRRLVRAIAKRRAVRLRA